MNTREDPQAQYNKSNKVNLNNGHGIDNSLMNNSSYVVGSAVNSPVNNHQAINVQNQRSQYKNKSGNMINTETTNANSEAVKSTVPHK